jgi:hypothetical protein
MSGTGFCSNCGAAISPLTEICPKCGVRPQKAAISPTWKPIVAGILDIIAGVIGVIGGLGLVTFPLFESDIPLGVLLFVFGVIAVIGGLCALRRRVWGLALTGAIFALWPGFLILGILAIVWTAMSRQEFE